MIHPKQLPCYGYSVLIQTRTEFYRHVWKFFVLHLLRIWKHENDHVRCRLNRAIRLPSGLTAWDSDGLSMCWGLDRRGR